MLDFTITTTSAEETRRLAAAFGQTLRGGEMVELLSDLGGGKTTFVKGLAAGMGVTETVQSPTFTISRIYQAHNKLELHHFDFYRLHTAGIMAAELAESRELPNVVVAVEWADVVRHVLPANHIKITLRATGEVERVLDFHIPQAYDYLNKAVEMFIKRGGRLS